MVTVRSQDQPIKELSGDYGKGSTDYEKNSLKMFNNSPRSPVIGSRSALSFFVSTY